MATTTAELDPQPRIDASLTGEHEPVAGTIASCLGAVREALSDIVDVEAATLSDADLRAGLQQVWEAKAGLDELFARLVSAADDRSLAIDDGASCTRAWLAWMLKMSRSSAAAVLAQASALSPRVEQTRRAWATGEVSTEQAAVILRTVDGLAADIDAKSCQRAETILIEKARELTHPEFRILADHVIEVVDPEGADARIAAQLEAEEARAIQLTQLRRYRRGDGTSSITGRLPDLQADMLYAVLDSLAAPRRAGAMATAGGNGAGVDP